jgi:cytochrome c-type biogenesis protein CcsB
LFGIILLTIVLAKIFNTRIKGYKVQNVLVFLIGLTLLIHTIGLGIRWFISGHAPWSNAYETMIFIAWSAVLAGLIFSSRNKFAPAIAAIMASVYMVVGSMSWMDPQLTNLVPVLKSKWLIIHVAVITSSYGFLGIGGLMAFVNLLIMSFKTKNNQKRIEQHTSNLSRIVELVLTSGVFLVAIGTFLGAVWANVSWGRYWAWDPKETWALITVLVYSIVLHLRLIPSLKSEVLFNFLALIAYASVLMTYFGVNYYLSGLHSYATGDPAPVPKGVYYALGVIALVTLSAIMNSKTLKKS